MGKTNQPASEPNRSAARDRGDIQQGYTGDKVKGFDPAMAPMETDAEAGGVSQPVTPLVRSAKPARAPPKKTNSSSHGSAMRPFEGEQKKRALHRPVALFTLVLVAALVAVALLIA